MVEKSMCSPPKPITIYLIFDFKSDAQPWKVNTDSLKWAKKLSSLFFLAVRIEKHFSAVWIIVFFFRLNDRELAEKHHKRIIPWHHRKWSNEAKFDAAMDWWRRRIKKLQVPLICVNELRKEETTEIVHSEYISFVLLRTMRRDKKTYYGIFKLWLCKLNRQIKVE